MNLYLLHLNDAVFRIVWIAIIVFFLSILGFIFGLANWITGYFKGDKERIKWGKGFFFPSVAILLFVLGLYIFAQ